MHAWDAVPARAISLSDFLSIENKGSKIQLPKLEVASHSGRASTVDRVLQLRRFEGVARDVDRLFRKYLAKLPQSLLR